MDREKHSKIDRALTMICTSLATLGLLALIAISALTVIEAVMRKYFVGYSIDGLSDWLGFCVIIAVSCCFPATIWGKHSITVRILGKVLPWRYRELCESIGQTILFFCLAVIAWQLYIYTYELWDYGDVSDLLLLPKWPVWSLATAIWWLTAVIQGYIAIKQWLVIFGSEEPEIHETMESL